MSNQTCEVIPVVKKVISEIENPDYQAQAMFWAANDHASRCELVEQAHTEALQMNAALALRNHKMVKQYQDVKVSDLQCIYEIQGEETVCDADTQQATVESSTYEWLVSDTAKYGA